MSNLSLNYPIPRCGHVGLFCVVGGESIVLFPESFSNLKGCKGELGRS